MTAAIALSDLRFQYKAAGFSLVSSGLNFVPGELSVITGSNGSGKTTLSKLMCGILRPTQGELWIYGKSATQLSLGQIGTRIGYLFQDPARQLFAGTVWKEMTFASNLLGEEDAISSARALGLLRRLGLETLKERNIFHLSGGEKQRLALATILMAGADFLILDEPTVGLDLANRKILYEILDDLLSEGTGLAVVSHEKELIRRYPHARRIRVENGQVLS